MTAAERLKRARIAAGLTQEQLAERIGTSKQGVSNAERGKYPPTLEWLHAVAVAIGCPPSELDERLTSNTGELA